MKTTELKCVSLKGEIADWGKHVLLPSGVTLCGMPTIDVDLVIFPELTHSALEDMRFEYKVEDWDITCERCMEMISIIKDYQNTKE